MTSAFKLLLHNPTVQLGYLLCAVAFLSILYLNDDYNLPSSLLKLLLLVHILFLAIRLIWPAFLSNLLSKNTLNQPNRE